MNEIWININGYDGDYQISNYGQVKSFKRGTEKILSPGINNDGYLKIGLSKNGKTKFHNIHRLVAEHFVPGYQEGMVVNHIDEDKTNNHVSNLEWVTIKQNTNHGTGTQRASQTRQSNKGKSIYCPELDMIFSTQTEASRYFGCGQQHISRTIREGRTVKGFHLIYR